MWFICNFAGILCILVVYTAIILVNISVVYASYDCQYHLIFFELLVLIQVLCHLRSVFTNPGQLQKGVKSLDSTKLPSPFSIVMEQRYIIEISPVILLTLVSRFQIEQYQIQTRRQNNKLNKATPEKLHSDVIMAQNGPIPQVGRITPTGSFFENRNSVDAGKTGETLSELIDMSVQRYLGTSADQNSETERSQATSEVNLELDDRGLPSTPQNLSVWKKRVKQVLNLKCQKCQSMKPPRTHHCRACQSCIVRMDHHCPWINNCVGIGNQNFFLQFLVYTIIGAIYSSVFLFVQIGKCLFNQNIEILVGNPIQLHKVIIGLFSFFITVLFLFFTLVLLFDQLACIAHNTSAIDRVQTRKISAKMTFSQSMQEVFGCQFSCYWIIPIGKKRKFEVENQYNWANLQ